MKLIKNNNGKKKMAYRHKFERENILLNDKLIKDFLLESNKNIIFKFLDNYLENKIQNCNALLQLDDICFSGLNLISKLHKLDDSEYDLISKSIIFARNFYLRLISECPYINITLRSNNDEK